MKCHTYVHKTYTQTIKLFTFNIKKKIIYITLHVTGTTHTHSTKGNIQYLNIKCQVTLLTLLCKTSPLLFVLYTL